MNLLLRTVRFVILFFLCAFLLAPPLAGLDRGKEAAGAQNEIEAQGVDISVSIGESAGILHEIRYSDTLWDLAQIYGVKVEDICEANSLSEKSTLYIGQEIYIPGGMPGKYDKFYASRSTMQDPNRKYLWPAQGRISSFFGQRWGRMHEGLDIAALTGTPVVAAKAGRVVQTGWYGGYGETIMIDHRNNVVTLYGHLSKILVEPGQQVEKGQTIGEVGNTGRSTGPHLHFEVRIQGEPIDPLKVLR